MPKEHDWQPFPSAGLNYVRREPLRQINYCNQLSSPGSYWVENSLSVHHPPQRDDAIQGSRHHLYLPRSLFSPAHAMLLHPRPGLEFEFVGNGCPLSEGRPVRQQRRSLDHRKQHRRWANGVGIDIGFESPQRSRYLFPGPHDRALQQIYNCGVQGIGRMGGNEVF